MPLIILLIFIFWVLVPGLLTGWMLREHGRSFAWGLLPGALLGPSGILATLLFVYLTPRRPPHGRAEAHGRGFRPFYRVPLVGRLHVSTAWSLAGVVAFLCAWMIGGLGYEFYAARQSGAAGAAGQAARAETAAGQPNAPGGVAPSQLQPGQKPSANTQANPARPAEGPLLSGLAAQTGQSAQVGRPNEGASAQSGQTPAGAQRGLAALAPQPATEARTAAASPPAPDNPTPAPARPAAEGRAAAVSEVTRSLGAEGHRVHAAVSGDAQTTTLSVSGPTLTRQAGNQLLGNGRTRQALKGAGIRVVVLINGSESWTYIL
jgi:hypothetical protein